MTTTPVYTKKDFSSDQMVRWCPGCGDYAILAQVQAAFSEMGVAKENFAIIAGIGCSSRFPYYMETYGFHTIHGRAPGFATGVKATRPELSVWVVTGDGDALSIGGNHIIHLFRRNVDVNVMMFNNKIYGLTKGQYSPTSELGKKTKSSPMGSIDAPFQPLMLAIGSGATYVCRSVDVFTKHLAEQVKAMHQHTGTSFIEIYQNCNIFNDGAWTGFTDRGVRDEKVLYLEPGKPLVWGKERRMGLVAAGFGGLAALPLVTPEDEARVLIHDPTNRALALALAQLDAGPTQQATDPHGHPMPVPVGVFYTESRPTYDSLFQDQLATATARKGIGDLQALLDEGDTWTVE